MAYEDWNNTELADALQENDEFLDEVLQHIPEERLEEVPLWQWDRSDLIDYANEYLG